MKMTKQFMIGKKIPASKKGYDLDLMMDFINDRLLKDMKDKDILLINKLRKDKQEYSIDVIPLSKKGVIMKIFVEMKKGMEMQVALVGIKQALAESKLEVAHYGGICSELCTYEGFLLIDEGKESVKEIETLEKSIRKVKNVVSVVISELI